MFKDDAIAPDILSVMSLIARETDFQAPSLQEAPEKRFAKVTVVLKNSRSISYASRSLPDVSKQDIKNKFFQNTKSVLKKNSDVWYSVYFMRSVEDLDLFLKFLK